MSTAGAQVRAGAASVLAGVLAGQSMDGLLARAGRVCRNEPDRALLSAIAYGSVREHRFLASLRDAFLDKALKPRDARLGALIEVGLYQLRAMRIPAYAAVRETVAAATTLGFGRARGLVNALLRRYQREGEALEAQLNKKPAVRCSYPDWLADALAAQWPRRWERLLEAGNEPGPMTLRVNRLRTSRESYIDRLGRAGIGAVPGIHAASAVVLNRPLPVHELPGFDQGLVSVQDEAAQLAAPLLAPRAGERVLDACAAPGGKTTHLLECAPESRVLALDADGRRLGRLEDNLARLGLRAEKDNAGAAELERWWDGRPFQRILLDAPCSGTGVIRRHPDIKWLRRSDDAARLAQRQSRLLKTLWACLAHGGVLVYATCSILGEENTAVIADFLKSNRDGRETPVTGSWGEACRYGRCIAPGDDGMDGFYYARLEKVGG